MLSYFLLHIIKLYFYCATFTLAKLVFMFLRSRLFNKRVLAGIKEKYVVITGASDGIGKALALKFAEMKYNLIIIGRNNVKLESVKQEIEKHNVNCITLLKDFSQDIDFLELMEYDIGLLINNVGLCSNGPRMFIDDSRYQEIISVNIKNTFKVSQVILTKMMQMKKGYVVNIGSITGDIPMPMLATYASSKAMIKSWTEALHVECLPWFVNVELMNTGYVATKMSGIKKSNLFCPSPEVYASCIVKHFGSGNESFAYFPHLVFYFLLNLIPRCILAKGCLFYQYNIRKKIDSKGSRRKTD